MKKMKLWRMTKRDEKEITVDQRESKRIRD